MKPFEDSEAFTRLKQDRNIYEHAKHKRTESLPEVDSSIVSQMEQDKKKIQLLQQDLLIEKEYNQELNQQLQVQMEQIRDQNEKQMD